MAVYQHLFISQLYVLASYFLGSRLFDRRIGVYSALLASVSPVFLSFQYGGFQSDFFTVSVVFFALGLIAKAETRWVLVAGFLVFDLAMFLHEWTWTQYVIVLGLYLAVVLVREYRSGSVSGRSKSLLFLLVLSVVVDLAKMPLGVRAPSSAASVTNVSVRMLSHEGVVGSNHFLTTKYTGGGLNNPVFNFLIVLGSLYTGSAPLLACILFLGLTPFPLLHYLIPYRVLVNTPVEVPVASVFRRISSFEALLLYITLLSVALVQIACISFTPLF